MHFRNIALAPAMMLVSALGAQIPNSGFENWRTEEVFSLRGWQTEGNVIRTAAGTGFAARIEHAAGSLPSWLALADFNINAGPGAPGPAFAISSVPDSTRLRMRWNLINGDTGRVLVGFTDNGFLIDLVQYTFSGSAPAFQSLAIPNGSFASAPCDSGFIWLSSNLTGKLGAGMGWLEVDDITLLLAGNSMSTQLPNNRMEVWDSMIIVEPERFSGTDRMYSSPGNPVDLVKIHSAPFNGNYALRLETGLWQYNGMTDTLASWLISTASTSDAFGDAFIPSFPVNNRPASFRGYSFLQSQGDTPTAELNLFYQGNLVGNAIWVGGANHTDYRLFSADVQYDPLFSGIPDSATVILYLGNAEGSSSKPGNYWVVDELHLSPWATSVETASPEHWSVYPNPARDRVFISGTPLHEGVQLQLHDISGRLALEKRLASFSGRESLELQGLPAGMYTLGMQTAGRRFTQRFIITP